MLFTCLCCVGRRGPGHVARQSVSPCSLHSGGAWRKLRDLQLSWCLNRRASHFTTAILLVTHDPAFRPHQRATPLTARSTPGPCWRIGRDGRDEAHTPGLGEEAASASSSWDGHTSIFKYLSFNFFIYKTDAQDILKLI